MKKVKVYRFEMNGVGPYSLNISDYLDGDSLEESAVICLHEDAWTNDKNIGLFRDLKDEVKSRRLKKKIYSGCLSKEALLEWFKYVIDDLKILGFALLEYTVDEKDIFYTKSGRQIGFLRKNHPFRVLDYDYKYYGK